MALDVWSLLASVWPWVDDGPELLLHIDDFASAPAASLGGVVFLD